MMSRFLIYFMIITAAIFICSCKTKKSGTGAVACDTTNFKGRGNSILHYHFCYPKSWKILSSNGVFDEYVGESFQDSTSQYRKIFAIKLEKTSNGMSTFGNFEKYVDSSRTLIRTYISNIEIIVDRDTTWNDFKAHVFEFTGTTYNRPFWTSQLIIDGDKRNYIYVLNFQQRLDDEKETSFDLKTKNDLMSSFVLKSESDHSGD